MVISRLLEGRGIGGESSSDKVSNNFHGAISVHLSGCENTQDFSQLKGHIAQASPVRSTLLLRG
jgi:hypothetical protein